MTDKSVVISGMGAISAAGATVRGTLESFAAGTVNAGKLSLFESPLECPVFEASSLHPPRSEISSNSAPQDGDRTLRLAMAAVGEALRDAGLDSDRDGLRIGVCLGTTVACQLNDMAFYRAYREKGDAPMGAVDRYLKNNLADAVARAVGADGPSATVVNACSSGTDAVGAALSWLRAGMCDIAIAGGADELNRIPLCGFTALSVVSPNVCTPFDRDRQGLNLGEGAGIVVLETQKSAANRGVGSPLRVTGYGSACDAYHLTAPRPDGSGLEAALRAALAEAGVSPADVGFVNAHGTATRDNDKVEGAVLARVFGDDLAFLSTKGFTGHTLGAAGGLETIFAGTALREGWIPASPGFANKDDEIPIAPVTERTGIDTRCAVSTSLAFGGNNSALVIERVGQ